MIPTFLITFFAKLVGDRFAKAAAIAAMVIAALILVGTAKWAYDRNVESQYIQKVQSKATKATDQAAGQRAKDKVEAAKSEKEMHDAINSADPGGAISPAAHALACKRLHDLGRDSPSCRSSGSDGSEADPH